MHATALHIRMAGEGVRRQLDLPRPPRRGDRTRARLERVPRSTAVSVACTQR